MKQLVALLALLLLSGCATLSEDECRSADWYYIGVKDGRQGYLPERINDHREACMDYGVGVDHDAYMAGREKGLDRYCTAANGWREGRAGESYRGACPVDWEGDFLDGFNFGADAHALASKIDELEDEADELERLIDDEETTADGVREYSRDLRHLSRDIGRLEADLADMEATARARGW